MNKKLLIGIIFLFVVTIIVCIVLVNNKEKNNKVNTQEISKQNYLNSVELTIENWKDYFEIKIETEDETDAFGDIVSSKDYLIIKLKEPYYNGQLQNTAMKLRNLQYLTPAEYTFEFNEGSNQLRISTLLIGWEDKTETLTIDNIDCVKIKGTLIY